MSLKARTRPRMHSAMDVRKVMEKCAGIHTAASCLRYLDEQERNYIVPPEGLADGEDTWTTLPLCPRPVHARHNNLAPMLYHTFTSGTAFDRLDLMVDSFLFTQPLASALLVVWFTSANEMQNYAAHRGSRAGRDSPYVQLRQFDFAAELESLRMVSDPPDAPLAAFSDRVRMILLTQFGGIWVDADTVFLRDFSPLWPYEFATRWSYKRAHNTAVFRLFQHSRLGKAMWDRAFATGDTSFHPHNMSALLNGTGQQLLALPSPLVDPVWLAHDNITQDAAGVLPYTSKHSFFGDSIADLSRAAGQPMCKKGHLNFFDGAFAYHWSTGSDNREEAREGTYFHALKTIMAGFLEGRTRNIYGEKYLPA
jgi:hypothetical protein